ncbi:arsenical pump-driving ATPase [soil metagenome]
MLTLGTRWTLVGGKGGVGKTTTAAALGVELAEAGDRVLLVSLDPAHSLGDALGQELSSDWSNLTEVPGLGALEVEPEQERRRFLADHRAQLLRLIERGTYLDGADAAGLVDLKLPGMDEIAGLFRLLELSGDSERRVILDTAPTGHTLRLLELTSQARSWVAALHTIEEKHQAVVQAIAGAATVDDVTRMLHRLDHQLDELDTLIRDPLRTRFIVVTTAEPVVLAETRRYTDRLTELGISLGGVVVNRYTGGQIAPDGEPMLFVPPLEREPCGRTGLSDFARAAGETAGPMRSPDRSAGHIEAGARFRAPEDRKLYLVGGKGGVGKSTVACALAMILADADRGEILLLSTDPAGSLGDVLGAPVDGERRAVSGVPRLRVQQLDAAAGWRSFQSEYRREVERLFEGLTSGGSATDRRVVEQLIDLAPPGLDELIALLEIVELLDSDSYAALVLDTAPTGHLLRLLEMPELALEWSHALLRLLLKYRDVVGLGGLGERVLKLSRSLRQVRALLTDPERSWLLLVALAEALSVPETTRLAGRLSEMQIPVGGLLINRLLVEGEVRGADRHSRALLEVARDVQRAGAPLLPRGPAGPDELRSFGAGWRMLNLNTDGS